MRNPFSRYSGQSLYSFLIPISQYGEKKPFRLGINNYDNLEDYTDYLKERSHLLALSFMGLERRSATHVAVQFTDPLDRYFLQHMSYGNAGGEHTIHLPVSSELKKYSYEYLEALRAHFEDAKQKAKFHLTNDLDIRASGCDLETSCHLISLHHRGDIMRLAIETRRDTSQKAHLLPQSTQALLTSNIKNYSMPVELPYHIVNFPDFEKNFHDVCRQNGIIADFRLGGEDVRRITVSTNNQDHAIELLQLFQAGEFNVGLHHRKILTIVGKPLQRTAYPLFPSN